MYYYYIYLFSFFTLLRDVQSYTYLYYLFTYFFIHLIFFPSFHPPCIIFLLLYLIYQWHLSKLTGLNSNCILESPWEFLNTSKDWVRWISVDLGIFKCSLDDSNVRPGSRGPDLVQYIQMQIIHFNSYIIFHSKDASESIHLHLCSFPFQLPLVYFPYALSFGAESFITMLFFPQVTPSTFYNLLF